MVNTSPHSAQQSAPNTGPARAPETKLPRPQSPRRDLPQPETWMAKTSPAPRGSPSSPRPLHLFCDANLFLQCRPPEDLDGSGWSDYASVRLIVSDPVLREIDALKNKGNDRQSKRARAASATFRKMLASGTKDVRASDPTVTLHVKPQHRRSEELRDQLDYAERDDQLIGNPVTLPRNRLSNPLDGLSSAAYRNRTSVRRTNA